MFKNQIIVDILSKSRNYENVFKQDNVSFLETASNGYNILNLGFGGRLQSDNISIDINISANNVLNTKYIPHLSKLKAINIPNQGRNISFEVNVKI